MVRFVVRAGDDWNVVAHGDLARRIAGLRGGASVAMEVLLTNHRWSTADGTQHQSVTLTAENMDFETCLESPTSTP